MTEMKSAFVLFQFICMHRLLCSTQSAASGGRRSCDRDNATLGITVFWQAKRHMLQSTLVSYILMHMYRTLRSPDRLDGIIM